ncbi:hypothetical protein G9P44_000108 [Scheffersomyces stipitis]|nr:hypothetical protein G9P44_000108 [Scheffersomyces stipitis]
MTRLYLHLWIASALLYGTAADVVRATDDTSISDFSGLLIATSTKKKDTSTTTNAADTEGIVKLTLPKVTTTDDDNTSGRTSTPSASITSGLISPNKTMESPEDKSIFKLLLTIPTDDSYYNAHFQVGKSENQVDLRLDLIQPEVWVMNDNAFFDCDHIDEWWSSEEKAYSQSSDLPASITTELEYLATVCGQGGLYTSSTGTAMPTATVDGLENGDPYLIPYINVIEASGVFATDDIRFNLSTGASFLMPNFTFLNVNHTNMYFGGLGVAGNPRGSGFLDTLTERGIIKSSGYSLWFNNQTGTDALGQLIPGVVDSKYYDGDFYVFDMLPHSGIRFPVAEQWANNVLDGLILPTLQIDDVRVVNSNSKQSLSLKSSNEPIPIILDSRSTYNYLPLDVIVNLAIQLNAYYSNEAGRWLVECDTVADSGGLFSFVFEGLQIRIPLSEFMSEAYFQGSLLKFSSGERACYLSVLPTDSNGFNSLGLPFIKNIYLAVDNAGQQIALANSNRNLVLEKDDFSAVDSTFSQTTTVAAGGSSSARNASVSIAYIESGFIPFATKVNNTSEQELTFTFSTVSDSSNNAVLDIPARFSGAIIRSGEIIVTGVQTGTGSGAFSTTTILLPGMASAASERTTSTNAARSLKGNTIGNSIFHSQHSLSITVVLVFSLIIGICIL